MTQPADFWSCRREAVKDEERTTNNVEEARVAELDRAVLESMDDVEILAKLNLPNPDDLALGDDVSGFMAKAVPDRLRRRALRRLWRLNPVLANVDGLVDYGEDFTDAATVIENMQTTYQVGKGMLAHIQEMARQAAVDKADDKEAEAEPTPAAQPEPEIPVISAALAKSNDDIPEPDKAEPVETETQYATAAPRRMRFEFEFEG